LEVNAIEYRNSKPPIDEMNESETPKIIVDEDWKSQVEAEKEAARAADPASPGSAAEPTSKAAKHEPQEGALPPATLTFLLTTIATQAMIALGQVPNPITGKVDFRPQQAKHYIDTLSMLEEKTNGNRAPEESTLLTEMVHQLRMAYVMSMNAAAAK
jgi:hypothetical protein